MSDILQVPAQTDQLPIYFGSSGIAYKFVHLATRRLANFTAKRLDVKASADTIKALTTKDTETKAYWIEFPTWLEAGLYDVLVYETTTPTSDTQVAFRQSIEVVR